MRLPSPDAYRSAIQHPDMAFAGNPELAQTTPETNRYGIPTTYSGNFTATFHLRSGSHEWAVRCYTREISLVTERYDAITNFLEGSPDPALIMARLLSSGIMVEGERYDVIQMEWIAGTLLNDYVGTLVEDGDTARIAELADAILDLGLRLEQLGIAHGDIQHGNVLVDNAGSLRLVDYDDMFLPVLAHLGFPSGIGQENYQHPKRGSTHYDEKLDRFPFISIYVTLRALAAKPQVWFDHDGGEDCLIFRKADFLDPYGSKVFQQLDTIEPVKEFVDRFASICAGAYEEIPSLREFIDGRFHYARFVPKIATRFAMQTATRPAVFVSTSTPDRPKAPPPPAAAMSTPPSISSMPPQQSGWFLPALGGVLCLIVVLTLLGIYGHRSTPPSVRNTPSAAAQSRAVAQAVAPPQVVTRHTSRPTSAPRVVTTPKATSASIPTSPPVQTSGPIATSTPAPQRTTAAPREAAPEPTRIAKAAVQDVCSTPDALPHVVSLAPAQLSDDKRTASAGKSAIVTVDVAADGSVTDASLKDSTGDVTLDFAALSIARHSTYAAAELNCTAAPGTIDVTVTY